MEMSKGLRLGSFLAVLIVHGILFEDFALLKEGISPTPNTKLYSAIGTCLQRNKYILVSLLLEYLYRIKYGRAK